MRAWEGFWPRPRGASPQPSLLYSSAVDNGPVYVGRLLSSCQSNPLRWLDTSTPFHQPAAAQSCFTERTQSLPLLWEAGAEAWSGGQPDPLTPLTLHTPHSPSIQAYSMLQTVKGGVRVAGINPTDFPQWFVQALEVYIYIIRRSVEPHPGMRTGGLSDILPLIYHQRRKRSKEIHCLDRCREVFCIQIILSQVLK